MILFSFILQAIWLCSYAKQRIYYIATIEVLWDYAPSGFNLLNNLPLDKDSEASVFTKNSSQRIGKVYKKAVYREFTDATFTKQKPHDKTFGILGPVVKGEKGDSIIIYFKNFASRNYTLHPHTVFYDKTAEGAPYDDHTTGRWKRDDYVRPGQTNTYVWLVTDEATPAEGDPRCLTWLYHSHIIPTYDINSGPVGMIETCKAGTFASGDRRMDVDREFYMLLFVHDENQAWYLDENLKRNGINPSTIDKTDDDFKESNLMHAINGRLYGNLDDFRACQGEKIVWHVSALGTQPDIHTVSFNGNTVISDHHRTDAKTVFPAHSASLSMQANEAGRWLIQCQILDHIKSGMFAYYNVSSTCAKNSTTTSSSSQPQMHVGGKIRKYYVTAEEVEWDYAPTGYNSFDDEWLNKSTSSSKEFFQRGSKRIGGKYLKAMYFEYTNASFSQRKLRPANEAYLGFLGPVIKAEVGDKICVHFLNKLSINASFHPRGVRYNKANEGSPYADDTTWSARQDDTIQPNSQYIYEWIVPDYISPTNKDTPCIGWLYSSTVNQVKDLYSGLFGPMVTCRKGSLKTNGIPQGYDDEKFILPAVIDENESWYLKQNMRTYCTVADCSGISTDDEGFKASNKMHQINGYMYGNGLRIDLCRGKKVLWYGLGLGTEVDVHGIYFAGNGIEVDGNHKDSIMIYPGNSVTFSMTPDNAGKWGLTCDATDHYESGMKFTYTVSKCQSAEYHPSAAETRIYYIGIVEEEWNYAPNNWQETSDVELAKDEWAPAYTKRSTKRIGHVYKKALYREYTDATFRQMKTRTAGTVHLGLLGPFIKAEEGDEIVIVLKNMASRNYSINPHGVFYSKENEGAKYSDGNSVRAAAVEPNKIRTYRWFVPKRAAPGPNDGACITWSYYSGLNPVKDTNAGLVGPLITCRKGTLANGIRKDVKREFALLFTVTDENKSWYLDENISKFVLRPSQVDKTNADFKESNTMNNINGFVYSNGPNGGSQFEMFVGEKVAWYLLGIGGEIDIHTVHFHGNSFIHRTNSKHVDDVVDIFPGIFDTLEMVPVNPGTWLLHCHVNTHKEAGMETRFTVKKSVFQWGGNGKASRLHIHEIFIILAVMTTLLWIR
eukprot:gene14201-15683_t